MGMGTINQHCGHFRNFSFLKSKEASQNWPSGFRSHLKNLDGWTTHRVITIVHSKPSQVS